MYQSGHAGTLVAVEENMALDDRPGQYGCLLFQGWVSVNTKERVLNCVKYPLKASQVYHIVRARVPPATFCDVAAVDSNDLLKSWKFHGSNLEISQSLPGFGEIFKNLIQDLGRSFLSRNIDAQRFLLR